MFLEHIEPHSYCIVFCKSTHVEPHCYHNNVLTDVREIMTLCPYRNIMYTSKSSVLLKILCRPIDLDPPS